MSGSFRASLTFFLILNLVSFSTLPPVALAEEGSPPPETIIVTGDATSENTVQNDVNSNVTTVGEDQTPPPSEESVSSQEESPQTTIEAQNTNAAELDTSATSTSATGENAADNNSGDALIASGDANAAANVVNLVNTNIVDSGGLFMLLNIFAQFFADLDLRGASFADTCPAPCSIFAPNTALLVNNLNSATIQNDVVVRAQTGLNSASANAGDALIASGDANAAGNVVNLVNTNIIASNYLLLVFNNFGNWFGDLVFPSKYFFEQNNACCANFTNADITNENGAEVENEVSSEAATGENTANGNGGEALIATGEANSQANVLNQVNTNIFDSDSFFVAIRFFGNWGGNVFSAPEGISWTQTEEGLILFGGIPGPEGLGAQNESEEGSVTASNNNRASLRNHLKVLALTGENQANLNAGNAAIATGNANSVANVVNIVNTNVFGRNWVLALVNIFGDWQGNVAFGRPDLWVGETVQNPPSNVSPGHKIGYTLTVFNTGDTDATNVVLRDRFNDEYLDVSDASGGYENADVVTWNLGTLRPGEMRQVNYDLAVNDSFPLGQVALDNTASVQSLENDADNQDNVERTTIVVTRSAPPPPDGLVETHPQPDFVLVKSHNASSTVLAGESVDYKITLKNKGLGQAYEAKVTDVLYYDYGGPEEEIMDEREWALDTVLGEEEILITYTLEISPDAKAGKYTNRVQFRAKNRLMFDYYFLNAESVIEVLRPEPLPDTGGIGLGVEAPLPPAPEEESLIEEAPVLEIAFAPEKPFRPIHAFLPPEEDRFPKDPSQLLALAYSGASFTWPWLLISLLALLAALLVRNFEEEK